MLDMKLEALELNLNPWDRPTEAEYIRTVSQAHPFGSHSPHEPLRSRALSPPSLPSRVAVSETKVLSTIVPLAEYCLRVLLAPHRPEPSSSLPRRSSWDPSTSATTLDPQRSVQAPPWPLYESNLKAFHDLPLTQCPPHILDTIRACLPDAVARPDAQTHAQGHAVPPGSQAKQLVPSSPIRDRFSHRQSGFGPRLQTTSSGTGHAAEEPGVEDTGNNIGFGVCASATHAPLRSRIFTRHAEERFSWENIIAGVDVSAGGPVPVRWRGCSRGCLSFLDTPPSREQDPPPTNAATPQVEDNDFMDSDVEMEERAHDDEYTSDSMDLSGGLDEFD